MCKIAWYKDGTLRSGRRKEFPKEMYDKKSNNKLERGTSIFRHKGPITTVTWMDNKVVNLVSTLEIPSGSATRPVKKEKKRLRSCVQFPHIVSSYNKYMGGVDRNDEVASYCAIKCKSKKWLHRIFFELLNSSIVNSHMLELESQTIKTDAWKIFVWSLQRSLSGNLPQRKDLVVPPLTYPQGWLKDIFPVCCHLETSDESALTQPGRQKSNLISLNFLFSIQFFLVTLGDRYILFGNRHNLINAGHFILNYFQKRNKVICIRKCICICPINIHSYCHGGKFEKLITEPNL